MDFGDIIEPVSRAFWDGYDEIEDVIPPPIEIEWEETNNEFLNYDKIQLLLIMEGSNMIQFGKSILIKDLYKTCNLQGAKLTAFIDEEAKNVVCLSEENNLKLSSIITERLVPCLKSAKDVVVISVLPRVAYTGEDIGLFKDEHFTKGINSQFELIKELGAPNFITGACGGGASWRYVNNLPMSCYVMYAQSNDLDSMSAKPIIRMMEDMGLKCVSKYIPKLKDNNHLYA